jgi:long-chain fatty acid transport protein
LANKLLSVVFALIGCSFFTSYLTAGGFQVNEHGARGTAMGGAVFATLHDASAIYFNPGALGYLTGTSIVVGSTFIFPDAKFRGPAPSADTTSIRKQIFYPSVLYSSYTMRSGFAFGVGIFNPYGLGTKWPADWVGRFIAIESTLRTFFINPTVAYKFNDYIGIGAGYNYVLGNVKLTQALAFDPFAGEGTVNLSGSGRGYGWNLGIYLTPDPDVSIGLAYRSRVTIDFEGEAEYSNVPGQLTGLLPGNEVKTSVLLPANVHAGIAFKGIEDVTISFGYQYIFWSDIRDITVEFDDRRTTESLDLNYTDGYILRVGLEYVASNELAIRFGYLFDANPTPDEYLTPRLPDSDRHGITMGIGYNISETVCVDIGYMFLRFVERRIDNSLIEYAPGEPMNGRYNSSANLLSLNLRFNF